MGYVKAFDPGGGRIDTAGEATRVVGDRRDGAVYVYAPSIILAVNVAMAVGRPLLISGPPGSGKSSLAANVARWMNWRYYEDVVTARTQARDLLWGFDAVRRLGDAQANRILRSDAEYVEPGVLWWAFNRDTARTRGVGGVTAPTEPKQHAEDPHAVVLIDEIDKADPDIPNSLLVALGSMRFKVEETGFEVVANQDALPFVVITTNEERELPKAFLRRCVTLTLTAPGRERLLEIAAAQDPDGDVELHAAIADVVLGLTNTATGIESPSTAEFIDAIRACQDLDLTPESTEWEVVQRILLTKNASPRREASSPALVG